MFGNPTSGKPILHCVKFQEMFHCCPNGFKHLSIEKFDGVITVEPCLGNEEHIQPPSIVMEGILVVVSLVGLWMKRLD